MSELVSRTLGTLSTRYCIKKLKEVGGIFGPHNVAVCIEASLVEDINWP